MGNNNDKSIKSITTKNNFFIFMKKIFSFLLLGLVLSIGNAWADAYTQLYSADFTSVATHSYTQNKTFTLGGKSWTSSVSQVNGGVFYLGCNSNNASKGVLNNNATFSSVVTALCSADDVYNTNKTTAHAYALLFENSYDNVEKVSFNWAGGNNAFQVYLFGDSGSGYELLGSTNYSSSGAAVAGSVDWTGSATSFTKFAIVARPGATSSTATNKTLRAASFTIYEGGGTPTVATPTFTPAAGTYTSAQNVSIACSTEGSVIHYTTDGTAPTAQSAVYSSPIAVSATTTIKAIAVAEGYENSAIASATYAIVEHAGTLQDPYSVADAKLVTPATETSENVYIRGIVSAFYNTSILGDGTNYRYYISDDGTTTNQLLVYKGKGLNNVAFSNVDDLQIGDEVVILGGLTIYNTTYEIAANNYIVSLNRPVVASIDVNPNSVEVTCAETNGTINVTYNNISDIVAEVYFCNAQGDAATYDWVAAEINAQNNVDYIIEANTGAARTAYLKVYALDDESNEVYSELITISQKKYVAPFVIVDGVFDFVGAGEAGEDYGSGVEYSTTYVTTEKTWTAGNVTMTTGKESGTGYRWWEADGTLRFYSGAYASFSVPAGYLITKIVNTGAKFDVADSGTLSGSTWTGCAEEVTLSVTDTRNIKTITITYIDATPTLGANGWSTFSAPFKFAVTGAEVYMAAPDAEQNATKVILSKVENGIVPAEEGVILKGTEGATVTITPTNAEASDYDDNLNDLMNTAVAPAIASEGSNMYVLATIGGTTAFYPCGNITIPMNKAWMFIFPAANQAPDAIRIEFAENNATNIQNLEGSEKAVKFIENGKLFILREGVVYDATGRMVK